MSSHQELIKKLRVWRSQFFKSYRPPEEMARIIQRNQVLQGAINKYCYECMEKGYSVVCDGCPLEGLRDV